MIAANNLLGAKRATDTARFTPVPKNHLIVKLPSFRRRLVLGYCGLFPDFVRGAGLWSAFLGRIHGLCLDRIAFTGLSADSVYSR
jgi:hypothetical protein